MITYIASKLLKYLKKIVPSSSPRIEDVTVNTFKYKGTSDEFYDCTRPTFALNFWTPSQKEFYILDMESKTYIPISKRVPIHEMTVHKPAENLNLLYKNAASVVTRPLNMYVRDENTGEFTQYKSKLKIFLDF